METYLKKSLDKLVKWWYNKNMNKWLLLSDGLYLFGENAINRVEKVSGYLSDGKKSVYVTALYNGQKEITRVTTTVEEIKEMLKNG